MMSDLFECHNEITLMFVGKTVAFTFKPVDSSLLHAWFHMNQLICLVVIVLSLSVLHHEVSSKRKLFLASTEEFFKCTITSDAQILAMGVDTFCDCVFVNVSFDLFDHFDLFAGFIKGHYERVG